MNKQTEKVRRYQAARVRLPNIMLSSVDRANLDVCVMRHGTTASAVKGALMWAHLRTVRNEPPCSYYSSGEPTGEQLQSIFLGPDDAVDWFELIRLYKGGPHVLRQALHEYATHITKAGK